MLSLFDEWCRSKDIYGEDKHELWRRVRKLRSTKEVLIREGSEEFVRISAVLEILLERDLAKLSKMIEKKNLGKGE